MTSISIQSCIHFRARFCIDDRRVEPIPVWKWLLVLPDTHVSSCSTLSQLEPDEKIHWWDNLVIQYIQELCWLAVPRPDQLNQPQIITLPFADLNRNENFFFLTRQCVFRPLVWIAKLASEVYKSRKVHMCKIKSPIANFPESKYSLPH